uniref:Leucine-rich repeat-containing protein 51 n=1 Tax=Physcomitrium patens TaxID=3218 RepID=A0A2K1K2A9_PHYPA|nr:hypothetical protein PHYPA_012387 [Physcomitrium patens]
MTGGEVADARVCEIARQQLKLGQRVSSLNTEKGPQLGSVKFVGIVNGFKGIWVGVDWDSGQGRHNGVVDGVRYFDTVGEKSGSFVRPHTLSTGVSLLDALTSKYRASSNRKDEPDEEMYVLSTGIEELDLTGNLLPDWHEVKRICDELPALRILELSCSRFPFAAAAKPLLVSSNLTGVALNHCGYKRAILDEAGGWETLVGQDGNEDAGGFVQGLQTLRLLNLDDNYLEDWQEVMKLSKLPSLAKLCLNGNRLTLVEYLARSGDRNSTSLPFVSLLCLYLGRNNLADWSSVDALDWFPSLQDVRLSDNPLTDHKTGTATRFMLIARMGSLSCLNGSLIKPRERRDSEIRYVRHVLQTMRTQSKERIIKSHPRFEKLRMIHDLPEDIWSSGYINTANSDSFANNFFAVTIECVAAGVGECASITKKLPLATTIGKLKVVCESLFKLPSNQQRLYFKDQAILTTILICPNLYFCDSPIPIELKDDLETLADVGIGPGRIIILDEI